MTASADRSTDRCLECARFPAVLEDLVGWRHFHSAAVCWELVWQIYDRHLGIRLPYENALVPRDQWANLIDAGKTLFARALDPGRYDVVLMRGRSGDHIGVLLDPETVLHVFTPASGVSRNRLGTFVRSCESIDFYRYLVT